MKYKYDEYYTEKDLFGKPYDKLIEFFKNLEPKGKVLDLGCGQGRDSIPLERMGYSVVGVDESGLGISQMNDKIKDEDIDVTGIVGDIYSYEITREYDIVLMDSMLHFYKNDEQTERALVARILSSLRLGGVFCNCMLKGNKREKILKEAISESCINYTVLTEQYIEYPEFRSTYHFYAIEKRRE
jgi:2-polyprenyl-3-methyl-5-hydroxy-6-metoxy-1,4-benzoquinol methylase